MLPHVPHFWVLARSFVQLTRGFVRHSAPPEDPVEWERAGAPSLQFAVDAPRGAARVSFHTPFERLPPQTTCSPEYTGNRQHLHRRLGGLATRVVSLRSGCAFLRPFYFF